MDVSVFLKQLNKSENNVDFNDLMLLIEANYKFSPTPFKNGELINEAGQNNASCKLFSFAKLHQLTKDQTLACFGAYYRDDVLKHPDGGDHQNIRNFMKTSWAGIEFEGGDALLKK